VTKEFGMSSEHSREVLKEIALEEPGGPKRAAATSAVFGAMMVGVMAVFAMVLIFMMTAPSRLDLVSPPKPLSEVSK
jgi:hypothetical protein